VKRHTKVRISKHAILYVLCLIDIIALVEIHERYGDENFVNREFTQMYEQISAEGHSGFMDCFRTPSARSRVWLGIFINIFNNLGGTPVISVYQAELFAEIGFTGARTLFLSGFYGLAGFVGTLINIGLVADRMGRKKSMCMSSKILQSLLADLVVGIGAITLLIDLSILMPLSKIYTGSTNQAGQAAAVTFIFLHSFVYSVFMFGTVWVYTTEIFPTNLRAPGTAICIFWGQAFGILLQQVGLKVFEDIGYLFYIVFITCTFVAGLVYYFVLPETRGATLEDISGLFGDEVIASLNESKIKIEEVLGKVTAGSMLEYSSACALPTLLEKSKPTEVEHAEEA
jgi:MFS family permease